MDITVEVIHRSGAMTTFVVPKTMTLIEFGQLVELAEESPIKTFKVVPCLSTGSVSQPGR